MKHLIEQKEKLNAIQEKKINSVINYYNYTLNT
jgi:hypothetical protein